MLVALWPSRAAMQAALPLLLALGGWPRPPTALAAMLNASVFGKERMQRAQELLRGGALPLYSANATRAALERQWARPLLPKRVHGARWRLLFVAGLEGSGHHLWIPLLKRCVKARRCAADVELGRRLWTDRTRKGLWSFETKLYAPRAAKKWEYAPPGAKWLSGFRRAEGEVRTALRRLSRRNATSPLLASLGGCGMMSYPNFPGKLKMFQTPDVRLLAELAEDEGVDFRILVLHRPAAAVLRSTTIHRHFGSWNTEAVVLEHNAQTLLAQLQSLDPAFVLCTEYDRLPEFPEGLEAFLGSGGLRRLLAEQLRRLPLRDQVAAAFRKSSRHNVSLSRGQEAGARFLQLAVDEVHRVARCGVARV